MEAKEAKTKLHSKYEVLYVNNTNGQSGLNEEQGEFIVDTDKVMVMTDSFSEAGDNSGGAVRSYDYYNGGVRRHSFVYEKNTNTFTGFVYDESSAAIEFYKGKSFKDLKVARAELMLTI